MDDETELPRLERQLRGIREPAMRRERLLEALEKRDAGGAYDLVAAVVHRPETESPPFPTLRRSLHEMLLEGGAVRPLTYELRASLYSQAAVHEDEFVMRLLRSAHSAEAMANPGTALSRSVAEIPLGMRRALSKGVDMNLLDRLLLDPDPIVIENLLENPRITENDAVRIGGRRPIPGSTLVALYRSRRFGRRLRVRMALACNPYCPTDVALQVLAALDLGALRQVARDATLHEDVRNHARDELTRRGGS
jgi:hypothetical protein